jgi:6-pyruvoyltetrahydropterin/6-carboxytetrahydropterin synthase
VFGKCFGKTVHGHNYELTVTLCGEPDPETGMVYNLQKLSALIQKYVVNTFDHTNINNLKILKKKVPTSEVLCSVIWTILEKKLPQNMLYKIELRETDKNMVAIEQ